jgi:hypothetical protein
MLTEHGLVVNASGDTLRGQISIKRSAENPRFVDLRQDGIQTRYRPHQISSFQFNDGTRFIGIITSVDKSPSKLKDFDDPTLRRGAVTDTVFLFQVVAGDLGLYRLVDENGKTHFFVEKGQALIELIRIIRKHEEGGHTRLETFDEYKNQLKSLIRDCPRAEALIDGTSFYLRDLSKVIVEYNHCQPARGQVKVQHEAKAQAIVSALGGLSIPESAFRLNGNFGPYLATYSSSATFTGGGVIEILSQKRLQGLAVANEFVVWGFNFIGNIPQGNPYYLDYQYFRYNLGGRYYFLRARSLKPFLQVGAGIGYAYQRSFDLGPYNIPLTNEDYGLHAAAGVKYNRISLQGRIDRAIGPSEAIKFTTRVNNWQILFGFDLIRSSPD